MTVSTIKEEYQRLAGVTDRDERDGLTADLRYHAVTKIFEDLQMLPTDLSETETDAYRLRYSSAEASQRDLTAAKRAELLDNYGDSPAVQAAGMLQRMGLSQSETVPILRTMLVMMDAEQIKG